MDSSLSPGEACRCAAEALAVEDPGTLCVVIHPEAENESGEQVEAAAMVADNEKQWAWNATTEVNSKAFSRSRFGESPAHSLDAAPQSITEEPFRGGITRRASASSMYEAIWAAASSTGREPDIASVPVKTVELDDELVKTATEYRERVTDEAEPPITVVDIHQYTPAAPAQWYAVSEEGAPIYIRYRGGLFQARAGGRRGVDADNVYEDEFGGQWAGAMATEELDDVIPADVMEFDFDLGEVDDFYTDVETGTAAEPWEFTEEDEGYDPDDEFASMCRRHARTAAKFTGMCAGAIAADAYRHAHPMDIEPSVTVDRSELRARRELLEVVRDSFREAAEVVDEDGDYATAEEYLSGLASLVDEVDANRFGTGIPTTESWIGARDQIGIADNQFRGLFSRVGELSERAAAFAEE